MTTTMKFLVLFNHPFIGKVYYGDRGILTSDGRKVVLIKYHGACLQGFYQSSGMVSGSPGTWFPFDGDVTNSTTGEALLLKVSNTNFASQFKTLVKKTKKNELEYQKNMIKFGTQTFLYISYKMGDGLWNEKAKRSKALSNLPKAFLENDESVKSLWNVKRIVFPKTNQSQKDVNLFLGNALSFNFLKGTEYPATFNGDWILHYKDIYSGRQYFFYKNTKISFQRSLLTKCGENGPDDLLLDFMMEYDHHVTSFTNFFYPSIQGQSIFENRYCKKFQ